MHGNAKLAMRNGLRTTDLYKHTGMGDSREVQMKRAVRFFVAGFIIIGFWSNCLAQDDKSPFDGFWQTKRGSIVKIEGDQGVFVYTPVESWKDYIDQVVIRNIHQKDDKWIAEEFIAPNGKGFWAEIEWELNKNRIIRRLLFQGKVVEAYYDRVGAGSANPGIHSPSNSSQSLRGKFGIGARVAHVFYLDDHYYEFGVKIEEEPDDAVMYGINCTYFLHEYFSLELSADYVETDVELSVLGLSGNVGQLTQVPVLLTGRIHFSTSSKVSPYLGGGVGYYFNDFDSERVITEFLYGPGADIDVDESIGYHVAGGVEVFVSDNAAINLDLRYVWNEIDAEINLSGFGDEELDVDAFIAGLGFKFYL